MSTSRKGINSLKGNSAIQKDSRRGTYTYTTRSVSTTEKGCVMPFAEQGMHVCLMKRRAGVDLPRHALRKGPPGKDLNAFAISNSSKKEVRGSNGTRLLLGTCKKTSGSGPHFLCKRVGRPGDYTIDKTGRCVGHFVEVGILYMWNF